MFASKRNIHPLTDCINSAILNGKFSSEMKMTDVIPIFKKDNPFEKANYRPSSLLPSLSKVYKKLNYQQLNTFLKINYLLFYVVSVQGIVLSMHY